jgi:mono/diheme cytochrome c family protein
MRRRLYAISTILIGGFTFYLIGCNSASDEKKEQASTTPETKAMTKEEMIKRGDYIVTTGSCNDCHSPKIMTQMGPVPDSTKLLSGHPGGPLPPINLNSLKPGNWISMASDITAFVGPWGISYAANLTPDSTTGIGAWSEATFMNTIRSGKHLGNGRDILPPMPWPFVSKLTDEDLKSVYTYLMSLPPVNNKVPAPVSPPDVMKMAGNK